MREDRQAEAEALRQLPRHLRSGWMREDGKWRITCWVHARPLAAFLALFGYTTFMGAAGSAFVFATLGASIHEPGALILIALIFGLFALVGLANWAITRYAARAGLRQLDRLRTLPPPPPGRR